MPWMYNAGVLFISVKVSFIFPLVSIDLLLSIRMGGSVGRFSCRVITLQYQRSNQEKSAESDAFWPLTSEVFRSTNNFKSYVLQLKLKVVDLLSLARFLNRFLAHLELALRAVGLSYCSKYSSQLFRGEKFTHFLT